MKKIAIVVGVDTYHSPRINNLSCCEADAKAVTEILQKPEYGFDVIDLYNSQATRKSIRETIEIAIADQYEFILLYFAGHGKKTPAGTFLCTYESDEYDEGISLDTLKRISSSDDTSKISIVFILDCCFSGSADIVSNSNRPSAITASEFTTELNALGTGKVVIAACGANDLASEDPKLAHGVFTHLLINGLSGKAANSDGNVTPTSLYEYITPHFDSNPDQKPVFQGDITGTLVLGSGFVPIKIVTTTKQEILKTITEAQHYSENISRLIVQSASEMSTWKTKGHLDSCKALEPIVSWFDKKNRELNLSGNKEFCEIHDRIVGHQGFLAHLAPGTITKNGVIDSVLGWGMFGTVYKVTSSIHQNPIAYKVYHAQDIRIKDKLSRFQRGYHAMKRLGHPNIVDVFEDTSCPVGFYMRYVNGPNLRGLNPEEILESLDILITISETLQHAHERGVVHRDVKPENIILEYESEGKTWKPFLSDFDLAWFSTATQLTKDAFGTMFYASPEQIRAPKSAAAHEPRTDIYSFGQLLYFTIAKEDPSPINRDENITNLTKKIHSTLHEEAASILIDLYKSCTELTPERRPEGFNHISTKLLDIRSKINNTNPHTSLSSEKFISEFIYTMTGNIASKRLSPTAFETRLGLYRVDVSLKRNTLELEITALSDIVLENTSRVEAKNTISKRIESFISTLQNVGHKRCNNNFYCAIISIKLTSCDYKNIIHCRDIVSRLITVIERA